MSEEKTRVYNLGSPTANNFYFAVTNSADKKVCDGAEYSMGIKFEDENREDICVSMSGDVILYLIKVVILSILHPHYKDGTEGLNKSLPKFLADLSNKIMSTNDNEVSQFLMDEIEKDRFNTAICNKCKHKATKVVQTLCGHEKLTSSDQLFQFEEWAVRGHCEYFEEKVNE